MSTTASSEAPAAATAGGSIANAATDTATADALGGSLASGTLASLAASTPQAGARGDAGTAAVAPRDVQTDALRTGATTRAIGSNDSSAASASSAAAGTAAAKTDAGADASFAGTLAHVADSAKTANATTASSLPTVVAPSLSANTLPDTGWTQSASLLSAGAGTASTATASTGTVGTPVTDPGFSQDLARNVVTLARGGAQSAELSLNPQHLGPVQVSIQMNGQQASLVISASHETTRAALQDSLPQLHQMFSQSGLQLTGAQVGDGSGTGGQRDAQQSAAGSAGTASDKSEEAAASASEPTRVVVQRLGLVDTFA